MERILKISGAYDGRSHPKNYGIGSMQIYFAVKGERGGVSCNFATSWYMPQNQASTFAMLTKGYPFNPYEELMQPKGTDVSFHSKVPTYENEEFPQQPIEDCPLTDGPCYCDGSALWAQEEWLPVFLAEGSEGIFKRLEQLYLHEFEEEPRPDMTPVPRTFGE